MVRQSCSDLLFGRSRERIERSWCGLRYFSSSCRTSKLDSLSKCPGIVEAFRLTVDLIRCALRATYCPDLRSSICFNHFPEMAAGYEANGRLGDSGTLTCHKIRRSGTNWTNQPEEDGEFFSKTNLWESKTGKDGPAWYAASIRRLVLAGCST
jgi:hypothetical protein